MWYTRLSSGLLYELCTQPRVKRPERSRFGIMTESMGW